MPRKKNNGIHADELLDAMPGGIARCLVEDTGYKFDFVNEGFLTLLGCSSEDLIHIYHDEFLQIVHGMDLQSVEETLMGMDKEGMNTELEFRLARNDHQLVWVHAMCNYIMDPKGNPWMNVTMTDVTSLKVDLTELRLKQAGFTKVSEHLEEVFFEWDLELDSALFTSNFKEKFGYEPIMKDFSTTVPQSLHVHPEDISLFNQALNDIRTGVPEVQIELRIKQLPDKYIWCKIRMSSQSGKEGHLIRAYGSIADIDEQKKMVENLLFKASRDSLTGIYNKATTQKFIEECITGEESHLNHALFIIDIDDFKHINDHLGHLFGDAVLKETASNIQHNFRDYDIVGRIGGDEFLVFLKNIPSKEIVMEKAQALMDVFRRSFTGRHKEYKISGSVGVAIYPRDGKCFNDLFEHADNALYAAKKQGKDGYCIYSEQLKMAQYKSVLDQMESEEQPQLPFTENLKEYIFNILYETKDMNIAVPLILEIVGKYYGVSRVYIFENSDDDLFASNTFEWCNEGVAPKITNLQNIPYSDFDNGEESYRSLFNEQGIFYCDDISLLPDKVKEFLESQKVCSVLQCSMVSDGVFKGFVGFDECSGLRLWTSEEIDMLTVISHILTTFLLKKRSEKELNDAFRFQKAVLDHINTAVYAINPETYEVFYFNEKTTDISPDLKEKDICYQVFWGRDTPCRQCPMHDLNKEKLSSSLVVYNEQSDVSSNITAAYINWVNGETCCLLSRFDFHKFKERYELLVKK
ncbi:diguanylate cyclase domain-containing protein [Bacillus sp. 1P06AnD]|uniref:sensor domain-containing diguanylate cyclase n=1 Tax=Bacillus sp. 1P06AnD TaxID=3132208 RepID=UPI0039A22015